MASLAIPRRLSALLGAAALVASACTPAASTAPSGPAGTSGAGETAGASAPAARAGIPSGGTLSIGANGEIQWLDPALGYDTVSWPAERLVFESLLDYDASSKLVPLLADGMPTVSGDGTSYTFTIQQHRRLLKCH